MGRIPAAIGLLWGAVLLAVPAAAGAGQRVALKAGNGRFLRAADDGSVRADRLLPGEQETFELVPCEDDHFVLKARDGRFLTADGWDATRLRADSPRTEPGDRETFALVHVGENRVGMKARHFRDFVVFVGNSANRSDEDSQGGPGPGQTVEIFHVSEIPSWLCTGLATAIRGLVIEELAEEEYDKIRTKKKVKYIELPAPTLRNLRRKKRHRVLSMTEEYHLKARLDGAPSIRIARMPYLKGYFEPGFGLLTFDVQAAVPVSGRVRYKIPDALSASTGYQTVVWLSMLGEVRVEKSGDELSLSPPELVNLRVEIRGLDLSNDVLHVARRGIEDLANRELRHKNDHIRQKANKAISKAIQTTEFRHPLLRYLALP